MKVTNIITTLEDGGAEANLFKLIVSTRNKFDHSVITLMDIGKYGNYISKLNIKVTCLNMPRGNLTIQGIIKLYKELKNNKPEIVQTWLYHSDLGGLVAKYLGIKKIYWNVRTSEYYTKNISLIAKLIIRTNAFLSHFIPNKIVNCTILDSQRKHNIKLICRIDTSKELDYYKSGGILQYVLKSIIDKAS